MTIAEAEKRYFVEVENLRKQHELQIKTSRKIWNIISAVLMVVGIILTIIGYTTPPVFDNVLDDEIVPFGAYIERGIGLFMICFFAIFLFITHSVFSTILKKGPNSLAQTKNLYFNYLKCVDMNDSDKEFYKEKIEEIRHMELVNAIHSSAAATSAAILFTTLNK